LDFVSPHLKDFSMIANAALMKSQVQFKDTTWWGAKMDVGKRNSKRPMIGTSPYVVNVGLYFDKQEAWGMQASLLYNVIGPRLIIAGGSGSSTDQYELSRHILDFVYSQRITKYLTLKLGVQDILNQPYRLIRDEDLSGGYNPGAAKVVAKRDNSGNILYNDYIESKYRPGSYYSAGITFNF